jgi:hypothetical protein
VLLLGVTAHVGEGEDGDGGLVRERQGGLRHGRGRRLCRRLEPVDTHRARDVLQLALAQVLEGKVETVAHLVVDRLRDEDAPRLGEPFEPCRDVDAVAVNPGLVVDDVPEVDADAEQHPTMLGHFLVAHRHNVLDLDCALSRADHAGELGEDAIAGRVDDAAAMAAHQRQDHGLMALEVADRAGLVLAHETAVAGDVGGKNGRESASD